MPIITRDEVKALLQISNTSKNTIIDIQIPIVQSFIIEHTNNKFLHHQVSVSATCSFSTTTNKIISSGLDFASYGFADGQDIFVYGTDNNDGIYSTESIDTGELTLSSNDELTNETDTTCTITKVEFPKELKIWVAKMISYDINNINKSGIRSESISRYSVSYGSNSSELVGGYPKDINGGLIKYRKLRW